MARFLWFLTLFDFSEKLPTLWDFGDQTTWPTCDNDNIHTDMGNPTVGLVYYTATLHYNCSFKSSLPYITTLL